MKLDYKIYCWWLNDEDMSTNRQTSLNQLKQTTGCEIVFITKKTLENYILHDYPLHEGYKYLSEIQQGDYLKCYFMHHYGGGYSDIKKTLGSSSFLIGPTTTYGPFSSSPATFLYTTDNNYVVNISNSLVTILSYGVVNVSAIQLDRTENNTVYLGSQKNIVLLKGSLALVCVEARKMSKNQIEAGRVAIGRILKKSGGD